MYVYWRYRSRLRPLVFRPRSREALMTMGLVVGVEYDWMPPPPEPRGDDEPDACALYEANMQEWLGLGPDECRAWEELEEWMREAWRRELRQTVGAPPAGLSADPRAPRVEERCPARPLKG